MAALDRLIPLPRLLEIDHIDVAASPVRTWELIRHGDLGRAPLIRALFAARALPERLAGHPRPPAAICLDQMTSSPERPGFQILADDGHEVAVAAIGKVWKPNIPFVHVADAAAYAAFAEGGWVKVAWALRVLPRGDRDARVEIEVRVDATDDASWQRFRGYFRIIGPGSHFIRRAALASLADELGTPAAEENRRALPGDELLPDAAVQITHGITIEATPEEVWPWLVQMGCRRAGFYSVDTLDNGGVRSAREVHPELQQIAVGDRLPAALESDDGFDVLRLEPTRALVLGGLHDGEARRQLAFDGPRPARYWHATWAFVLEPLDARTTRLHVRARAAYSRDERLHVAWIRPVHRLMQTAQLRHLAARAEGRLARDDWHDVLDGLGGAARMIVALMSPFARRRRTIWGLSEAEAARDYPGDERVPAPRWSWTHGIEIDAAARAVWPWVAQIGADRGGFYSHQWLENLVGCQVRNAEVIHPEWALREGDPLRIHPEAPAFEIVEVDPGRALVAFGAPDQAARAAGRPWIAASWLFFVEPLGDERCRLISRYRLACSEDLATRLQLGPALMEPIGFVMDRRLLIGIKERAERTSRRG